MWTEQLVNDLDVALNEADVSGLTYDEAAGVLGAVAMSGTVVQMSEVSTAEAAGVPVGALSSKVRRTL